MAGSLGRSDVMLRTELDDFVYRFRNLWSS